MSTLARAAQTTLKAFNPRMMSRLAATALGGGSGVTVYKLSQENDTVLAAETMAAKGVTQVVMNVFGVRASILLTGIAWGLLGKVVMTNSGTAIKAVKDYFNKPPAIDSPD